MSAPKVIIEGTNLSGKSNIVKGLEQYFVHSVVVTLHGYYHPKFLDIVANSNDAIKYHQQRLFNFIPVFKGVKAEELVFSRFHLTALVYLKLFYDKEENFYTLEKELNLQNVFLFLIDINDQALDFRVKERKSSQKADPWGDKELLMVKRKRDLYRYFFENSLIKNKFLVDNSNPPIELTIRKIVNIIENNNKNKEV